MLVAAKVILRAMCFVLGPPERLRLANDAAPTLLCLHPVPPCGLRYEPRSRPRRGFPQL